VLLPSFAAVLLACNPAAAQAPEQLRAGGRSAALDADQSGHADIHPVGPGRFHCSVVGEPASGEGLLDAEFDGTDDGRR